VNKPKIWLSSPHMGHKEHEFVREAFTRIGLRPWGRMWMVSNKTSLNLWGWVTPLL